jgi:hypothetical protein
MLFGLEYPYSDQLENELRNEQCWKLYSLEAVFAIESVGAIVAVTIVLTLAATIHGVDTGQTSNEQPPGTSGLARPHPPLDRASGEAVKQ